MDDIKSKVSLDEVTFISYEKFDDIKLEIPRIDLTEIIRENMSDNGTLCHLVNPNYLKKTEAEEKLGA